MKGQEINWSYQVSTHSYMNVLKQLHLTPSITINANYQVNACLFLLDENDVAVTLTDEID